MSTSRIAKRHRIISRSAIAGTALGIASLAVGIYLNTTPVANTGPDDSPGSQAVLVLLVLGLLAAVVSALVWFAETLWWWAHSGRADGSVR